jgi:hypothetical protein
MLAKGSIAVAPAWVGEHRRVGRAPYMYGKMWELAPCENVFTVRDTGMTRASSCSTCSGWAHRASHANLDKHLTIASRSAMGFCAKHFSCIDINAVVVWYCTTDRQAIVHSWHRRSRWCHSPEQDTWHVDRAPEYRQFLISGAPVEDFIPPPASTRS